MGPDDVLQEDSLHGERDLALEAGQIYNKLGIGVKMIYTCCSHLALRMGSALLQFFAFFPPLILLPFLKLRLLISRRNRTRAWNIPPAVPVPSR